MLRFLRRCVTNDALRRSKSTSVAQRCEIQTKEAELGKASEKLVFLGIYPGFLNLYVKFWWPLFLALKIRLFFCQK